MIGSVFQPAMDSRQIYVFSALNPAHQNIAAMTTGVVVSDSVTNAEAKVRGALDAGDPSRLVIRVHALGDLVTQLRDQKFVADRLAILSYAAQQGNPTL